MTPNRRQFLTHVGASVALAAVAGKPSRFVEALARYPSVNDPAVRELAMRAIDAAKAAGASYADVRLTVTRTDEIFTGTPGQWSMPRNDEHGAIGVRALLDGAFGFAASNTWTLDEAARLGHEAATQARTNSRGRRRRIELGAAPPAATGEWQTPIQVDPFTVPLAERIDVLWALGDVIARMDLAWNVGVQMSTRLRRQEKAFASTDGSFTTQKLYSVNGAFSVAASGSSRTVGVPYDGLHPMGGGWEAVTDPRHARDIPAVVEQIGPMLEAEPVEPDKYDIVVDGYTAARLVATTIGVALELDRAMGFEANATGTSYFTPGERYALGPAMLNVTANRSAPAGLATVKWDDDGVVPQEYAIVKNGTAVEFHTSRDVRVNASRGCASSEHAGALVTIQPPNLEMQHGTVDTMLEELAAGLERGLVVIGGLVTADRQQLNGEINPRRVYEVINGKRTRDLRNVELLFRAPELWKSLAAIGGARSRVSTGVTTYKGQPGQQQSFSVSAVPARFNKVAVTDRARLA
jgi:TldD protein